MNKISFSRQALSEYKSEFLKAIIDGRKSFVWKNNLVMTDKAYILLNKFKPHFINPNVNEVTIDYNF